MASQSPVNLPDIARPNSQLGQRPGSQNQQRGIQSSMSLSQTVTAINSMLLPTNSLSPNSQLLEYTEESAAVSRQMSIFKHRKKQAANDAQLLLNRIALLQKEEERARRKIEQTKDKAREILQMRNEEAKRVETFIKKSEENKAQVHLQHCKNMNVEEQSRGSKYNKIEKLMQQKRQNVKELKMSKQIAMQEAVKVYSEEIKSNHLRKEKVKAMEEASRQKKLALIREKERKKRELFLKLTQEEELEALKSEKLVKMLEKREREWLEKLHETQKIQEHAYVYLEGALLEDKSNEIHNAEMVVNYVGGVSRSGSPLHFSNNASSSNSIGNNNNLSGESQGVSNSEPEVRFQSIADK